MVHTTRHDVKNNPLYYYNDTHCKLLVKTYFILMYNFVYFTFLCIKSANYFIVYTIHKLYFIMSHIICFIYNLIALSLVYIYTHIYT